MSRLNSTGLRTLLAGALAVRAPLLASSDLNVYRLLDGAGDGAHGLYLDRYGAAAVLSVYDDAGMDDRSVTALAHVWLEMLQSAGIESIYVKRFARDRSRLGGQAPEESRSATPRAGIPQPATLVVREYASQFEVRLFDGFSTGLFLEHREHRRALARLQPRRALNLFAYTCAFAVPLAAAGAHVTNVDVSNRYLDWGRRNLELNGLDLDRVRFYRMDALEFLAWAAKRPDERFDLIVLDPPTFAAGEPRRKRQPWKAVVHYPELVRASAKVLVAGGRIFAASNTRELASTDALHRTVEAGLGYRPAWQTLPPWPIDVRESGRVAAVSFTLR